MNIEGCLDNCFNFVIRFLQLLQVRCLLIHLNQSNELGFYTNNTFWKHMLPLSSIASVTVLLSYLGLKMCLLWKMPQSLLCPM